MNEKQIQERSERRIAQVKSLGAETDESYYRFKSGHRINNDVINLFTGVEWNEFIGMIEKLELVN